MTSEVPATQNYPPWHWTKKRRKACAMLADGRYTEEKICSAVGLSRKQLYTWKQQPAFKEKRNEIAARLGEEVERFTISRRVARLSDLQTQANRIDAIIAERSEAYASVPGGSTGLMAKRKKMIGSGDTGFVVDEVEFDAALAKEFREVRKQAAIECGQWEGGKSGGIHILNSNQMILQINEVVVPDAGERVPNLVGTETVLAEPIEV